jgi:hypothetical protein
MNNILILTLSLMIVCGYDCKAAKPGFPDFSKTFPTEELLEKDVTEVAEHMETHHFATDLPYIDLEKLLLKFLGEGWSKQKIADKNGEMQDVMQEGFRIFSNPKHPDLTVGLARIGSMPGKEIPANGKKAVAVILAFKKPAQQDVGGKGE